MIDFDESDRIIKMTGLMGILFFIQKNFKNAKKCLIW